MRCDYVMHYSSVCKRGKLACPKHKVRAKFVKLV